MTYDPTLILLAAGASTRMKGRDKLLELVDGAPLLQVMAQRCAKVGRTRVVLGLEHDKRRDVLQNLDVEIVHVAESDGMAASIRAGVADVEGAVMVVLADMPDVMAADMHLLLGLHGQGMAPIVQAAGADGTPGQPVVFAPKYLKQLAKLQGDVGAKAVLKSHAKDVALVPLKDARALTDLDTPEAWAAWRKARVALTSG